MAEPTQFTFDLKEVAASLIEKQGITSGKWGITFEFNVSIGAFGKLPQDAKPGAMIQINRIQLVKAPDDAPDSPLVVDASALKISNAPKA